MCLCNVFRIGRAASMEISFTDTIAREILDRHCYTEYNFSFLFVRKKMSVNIFVCKDN